MVLTTIFAAAVSMRVAVIHDLRLYPPENSSSFRETTEMIRCVRQWATQWRFTLRVMACLLGLTLGANPLGAVVHTLSHLDVESPEKQALTDGGCALCAAYGHLTGTAPIMPSLPAVIGGPAAALPVPHPSFVQFLPCPYQGRAPPFSA